MYCIIYPEYSTGVAPYRYYDVLGEHQGPPFLVYEKEKLLAAVIQHGHSCVIDPPARTEIQKGSITTTFCTRHTKILDSTVRLYTTHGDLIGPVRVEVVHSKS